jgi:hypothetical protein
MKPEVSQQPSTYPYPEPDESSAHSHSVIVIKYILISPPYLRHNLLRLGCTEINGDFADETLRGTDRRTRLPTSCKDAEGWV